MPHKSKGAREFTSNVNVNSYLFTGLSISFTNIGETPVTIGIGVGSKGRTYEKGEGFSLNENGTALEYENQHFSWKFSDNTDKVLHIVEEFIKC